MKKSFYLYSTFLIILFSACEKEVALDLETVEPFLAVDAFLTNKPGPQQIILAYTQPYFDNLRPAPARGASVNVLELETERIYTFTDADDDGTYTWMPEDETDVFGHMGSRYVLQINYKNVEYLAASQMNPVPTLDSITFEYNKPDSFIEQDYWVGEFWARDLPGPGDTYWIKTWKNGQLLNRPDDITIAYDAGGSAAAEVDSLIFIHPLRVGMNPFDLGEEEEYLAPYVRGDSAYVEIHSITPDTWFFLYRVMDETFRPGGFGELFATPMANSPTNIVAADEQVRVTGFFSVSAVSSLGVKVDDSTIRDRVPDSVIF